MSIHYYPIKNNSLIKEEQIAEVLMSEVAFTNGKGPRPVLATGGCTTCLAVAGYESKNQIAFLAHFTGKEEVIQKGKKIFESLSILMKESIEGPIKIHLRGGIRKEHLKYGLTKDSEGTIDAIKEWMNQETSLPMVIASDTTLPNEWQCQSLAIDARSGEVFEYEMTSNLSRRKWYSEIISQSQIEPNLSITYAPLDEHFSEKQFYMLDDWTHLLSYRELDRIKIAQNPFYKTSASSGMFAWRNEQGLSSTAEQRFQALQRANKIKFSSQDWMPFKN